MPDRRQGDRRDSSGFHNKKLSISIGTLISIIIIVLLIVVSIISCKVSYSTGYDNGYSDGFYDASMEEIDHTGKVVE